MTSIAEAGVYDIDADTYHADPVPGGSLSSSGARKLLPPSCPAKFAYEREHGGERRSEFDIGTAAHKLVLGVGPKLERIDAKDWRTKKAQDKRDEAYEHGAVPLLTAEYEQVHAMADVLHRDDLARVLLDPDHGRPEQAIFWQDTETEVWRRALIDWLPTGGYGPPTIVDYKTTTSADLGAIRSSVLRYGYHQQAAWYLDAVDSVGYPDDTAFKFIFQEKTPPYLVTVVELDQPALRVGWLRNRRAIEIYRDCTAAGIWPGHATDIEVISLPPWAERAEEYA
ncbi:hypothetical protein GCM10023196_036080 [Actinoallomurus vinaceus]|uniref:Putative exodeoxyribonuclease 8 PDDEXK-like domain-containing protein n=1 Tax=Actinoallomurus vinaceus TaxID=1080074 RepID=A0ABP8U963_9ACTN